MDVTGGFFGKLRDLAVTVEKEVKQLERAMRREDAGKSGHGRHAWAWRLRGCSSGLLAQFAQLPATVPLVLLWERLWWARSSAWELLGWKWFGLLFVSLSL